MFPLGHIGITIGIVYLMLSLLSSRNKLSDPRKSPFEELDFRFVIFAALLPDIVDKIVGMLIFKDEFSNGRIFMHSAVVIGILSICYFIAARIKLKSALITICYIFSVWMHLLLDMMWVEPKTLFWPLMGLDFPRSDVEFSDYFGMLITNSFTYFTEILGGLIIIILIIRHRLFIKMHLIEFIKDGKLKILSES
ncbi:MAG: metal-dependent hydrolase [Thermoplasmata archaeon]|nr:MAG: metal-dependent hydrolase [Thermoplasmata archaeon]